MTRSDHETARSRDREIRTRLLRWYTREQRRLPWRGTRDPYRIWVSEVMLQQTTVGAVLPRFEPFLRRFPDVGSLARAREESVLAAWSGLGYYGRARNLWRAARRIVDEHNGRIPRDPETLLRLPGFGAYTAAAVASLAHGTRVPAAEANITRVLSRVFAIPGAAGASCLRNAVLEKVSELLPRARPGDLIAALMDLGQLICLPRNPQCRICPISASCAALRMADPTGFPRPLQRPKPVTVYLAAAVIERRRRVLLRRREASYLDGLWEFPSAESTSARGARRRLDAVLEPLGLGLESARPFASARHSVVNRRLSISLFATFASPRAPHGVTPREHRWFTAKDFDTAAIPTLTRRVAIACGFLPESKRRILFPRAHPRHPASARGASVAGGFAHAHDAQKRNSLRSEGAPPDFRRTGRVHDDRREGLLSFGVGGGLDRNLAGADLHGRRPLQRAGLAGAGRHRPATASPPGKNGGGRSEARDDAPGDRADEEARERHANPRSRRGRHPSSALSRSAR